MTNLSTQSVTCHECAMEVSVPPLGHKEKAHCPRCGYTLSAQNSHSVDAIIAFGVTALIFFLAALPFDFLSFSAQGQKQTMDIPGSVLTLINNDYLSLALIEIVAIFIIPLMLIFGFLYLVVPLKLYNKAPENAEKVFKFVFALIPWGMAEIFLVGTLVSLIKITSMADIGLGKSFIAYCFFTIALVAMISYVDKHQLQQRLGLKLAHHKPHKESVQHTWAFIVTACILYIPASVLPIMNTRFLGKDDPSTILGGVVLLWEYESYFIASVIFVASVLIPILKILVLIILNLSIQKDYAYLHKQRIVLYRMTEIVGRWSMIDVFVVAILVSLVQLGNTMSILPGPASIAFSGVVVLTILAAHTFDSTRIWSKKETNYESK